MAVLIVCRLLVDVEGEVYPCHVVTAPLAPLCPRHDGEVRMSLRTLHTDSARPGQILGLFECPDCGTERRLPFEGEVA